MDGCELLQIVAEGPVLNSRNGIAFFLLLLSRLNIDAGPTPAVNRPIRIIRAK
jgi:hypothetical protein